MKLSEKEKEVRESKTELLTLRQQYKYEYTCEALSFHFLHNKHDTSAYLKDNGNSLFNLISTFFMYESDLQQIHSTISKQYYQFQVKRQKREFWRVILDFNLLLSLLDFPIFMRHPILLCCDIQIIII